MGWVERQLVDPSPADVADAKHLVEFALHGLARDQGAGA
jgi:hypothetical protein